jgi:hypothetical protein
MIDKGMRARSAIEAIKKTEKRLIAWSKTPTTPRSLCDNASPGSSPQVRGHQYPALCVFGLGVAP